MKKFFNILGKIFNACVGIYGFICCIIMIIEFYGIITDNPNANMGIANTCLIGLLISEVYFQGKKINELKEKINN